MWEESCFRFPSDQSHCFYFDFFEILKSVLSTGKFSSHLRNSCRKLRIVAIERHQEGATEMEVLQVHKKLKYKYFGKFKTGDNKFYSL